MHIARFRYEVSCVVTLTAEEIYHAIDLALNHYDAKCRAAARPGAGAFLNGFRNSITHQGIAEFPLTFQELDLFYKILEAPVADARLADEVHRCLRNLSEQQRRVDFTMTNFGNTPAKMDQPEPEAPEGTHYNTEVVSLTTELLQSVIRRSVGKTGLQARIAQGCLAVFKDRLKDHSSEQALNEVELRALIDTVCEDRPDVQEIFSEALIKLEAT